MFRLRLIVHLLKMFHVHRCSNSIHQMKLIPLLQTPFGRVLARISQSPPTTAFVSSRLKSHNRQQFRRSRAIRNRKCNIFQCFSDNSTHIHTVTDEAQVHFYAQCEVIRAFTTISEGICCLYDEVKTSKKNQ